MAFLYCKIAHKGIKIVVHLCCRTNLLAFGYLNSTTTPYFTGCKYSDSLGRTYSLKPTQFIHIKTPHPVETVTIGSQHLLHQCYCRIFGIARAYKYSKELSIRQCLSSFAYHFLPWTIFFSPTVDSQFLHQKTSHLHAANV